jgi:DNA-binding GntR family transcriptional regulator
MADKRLSLEAYEAILRLIGSGVLPKDAKLDEAKLGEIFGMSRTPIREAIGRIESEKIAKRKGRLLVVSEQTSHEVGEIFFALRMLEPKCARAAAYTRSHSAGLHYRKHIEFDETGTNPLGAFSELRQAYVGLLMAACPNTVMAKTIQVMRNRLLVLAPLYAPSDLHSELGAMLQAIASGNAEAGARTCLTVIQAEEALLLKAMKDRDV